MEIKSLATTTFDTIFKAFNMAFGDYELQINREELEAMLQRRGFCPGLSFAAFEGEDIVAFTLNGTGDFNWISTAYDTGTGTLKEYRGQGLATQIFEYSLPYLKAKGIEQYLLEVLQHNTKAVSVYRKLGFEVTREFYYFRQRNEEIRNDIKLLDIPYVVEQINVGELDAVSDFWDFYPSWQNSFQSVRRSLDGFVCLGVFTENKPAGYCVFEPVSGDITQLAVAPGYRRRGIASLLLEEMIRLNRNDSVKVINTDIECTSVTAFLEAKNIACKGKQFEMVKRL